MRCNCRKIVIAEMLFYCDRMMDNIEYEQERLKSIVKKEKKNKNKKKNRQKIII